MKNRKVGMPNPIRDKNEGTYRGGERETPVTTAYPEGCCGYNLLQVELESKSDDKTNKYKKNARWSAFLFRGYRKVLGTL